MGGCRLWILLIISISSACTNVSRPFSVPPSEAGGVTAASFDRSGEILWFSESRASGCVLTGLRINDRTLTEERRLDFCPDFIEVAADGTLLAAGADGALMLGSSGESLNPRKHVLAVVSRDNWIEKIGETLLWRRGGETLPLPGSLRSPRILTRSDAVIAIQQSDKGESLIKMQPGETKSLTSVLPAIDSFDISPDEKEIVIAADPGKGFDVGLMPSDGGEIGWIFPEALPERAVTWAPRGNKVSYVIETSSGSLIRTVHVPTSFQLTVDFPHSAVADVTWEPKAEKFAVVTSSILRGSQIELLRYGGEERAVLRSGVNPTRVEFDTLGAAILLAPPVLRYGRRYPLVIWISERNPLEWSPFRAAVHSTGEVATVITARIDEPGFRKRLAELEWIDQEQAFVVYSEGAPVAPDSLGSTVIQTSPALRDRFEIRQNGRTVVSVPVRPPAEIEAFAAKYIRDRLIAVE